MPGSGWWATAREGRVGVHGTLIVTRDGIYADPQRPGGIAIVRRDTAAAAMPERAVVAIDLPVERYQPRPLRLLMGDGAPVPAGHRVEVLPSRTRYRVGMDGAIELNAARGDAELRLLDGAWTCAAAIPAPAAGAAALVCRDQPRAVPAAETATLASDWTINP